MNEFHHAPVDFIFTSPLNDSVLPPLRVSGDGVLREFGFVPGRGWLDAAMVWVLVVCFGTLTYFFLETAGRTGQQGLWGIAMAWLQSLRKRRRASSSGLASESPLAGVSQELAGAQPLLCMLCMLISNSRFLPAALMHALHAISNSRSQ